MLPWTRWSVAWTGLLLFACDDPELVGTRGSPVDAGVGGSAGSVASGGSGGAAGSSGAAGSTGGAAGSAASGGAGGSTGGAAGSTDGGADAPLDVSDANDDGDAQDGGHADAGGDGALDSGPPCPLGWGRSHGDCVAPGVRSLDVGAAACEVRADSTLWCWGDANYTYPTWQETRYPTQVGTATDWSSVTSGSALVCGVRAGGAWCLGMEAVGAGALDWVRRPEPYPIGTDTDWRTLSTNDYATCGIKGAGELWCWGSSATLYFAGIAIGGTPAPLVASTGWSAVNVGAAALCAIDAAGTVHCLGANEAGALGDGTTDSRATLAPILGGGRYVDLMQGQGTVCGLRDDGSLWCWGTGFSSTPTQVGTGHDWVRVAGHGGRGCALHSGGTVECVGQSGVLEAIGGNDYADVAGGCARRSDDSIACTGLWRPGDGSGVVETAPVRVGLATDWQQFDARWLGRGVHANGALESFYLTDAGPWRLGVGNGSLECGLRSDGSLYCWGNDVSSPAHPVQLGSDSDWVDVSVAYWGRRLCGVRSSAGGGGTLWCAQPACGLGLAQVDGGTTWTHVAAGQDQTCALRGDGALFCDPEASYCGMTGFTQVGGDLDWEQIAVGAQHRCGLRDGGKLFCWGSNNVVGQLGTGTRTATATPTEVAPGTTWSSVTAGPSWSCGVQTDGSLWCWGDARAGQLGLGVPGNPRLVPTRVGTASDWTSVSASGGFDAFTCGLRRGELWCWGQDRDGLLTRTPVDPTTPVTVVAGPTSPYGFCLVPEDGDADGYAGCLGDCDDSSFDVSPSAAELCNSIDDDCDGVVDEGCP